LEPITVIKCGGTWNVDVEAVCRDIAQEVNAGRRIALVHGGSADIAQLADRLDVPQHVQVAPDGVVTRRTDARMMEVVTLALAGVVKPRLVRCLIQSGVRAVGLTGMDGGVLQARRKAPQREVVDGRKVVVRDTFAGKLVRVDTDPLCALIAQHMVPVLSPPALAPDGELVNVDADRAAAAVAVSLGAAELLVMTGAPGVQKDPHDESTMLPVCEVAPDGKPAPWAHGGMAMKLVAAREALRGGVPQVLIADGRRREPVRAARAGAATRVVLGPGAPRAGQWPGVPAPAGESARHGRAAA
jgi:[amino group carrier protein]-L-2-aminoadipate 6-kinase